MYAQKGVHEHHSTTVAVIREFSNARPVHHFIADFTGRYGVGLDHKCMIGVHPSGYDCPTDGNVCVTFRSLNRIAYLLLNGELVCTIAVIDSEASRRFQQTSVMPLESNSDISIAGYVSRGTLLRDKSELLPDDTLTLHIDLIFRGSLDNQDADRFNLGSCIAETEGLDGAVDRHLRLDSYLARRLVEESKYFDRILATPMLEGSTGLMKIPDGEFLSFRIMFWCLLGFSTIPVLSVDEIFDLYSVADKYDIPSVLQMSRCWLKLCLSSQNAADVSEFADRYGDVELKEAVRVFLKRNSGGDEAVEDDSQTRASGEWTCKPFKCKQLTVLNCFAKEQNKEELFDFYS